MIALSEMQIDPELTPHLTQSIFDLRESGGSVDVRLAGAEQVQVGAVQNGDLHFFLSPSSHAVNHSMSPVRSSDSAVAESDTDASPPGAAKNASNVTALDASWGTSRKRWSSDNSESAARVGRPDASGVNADARRAAAA